LNSETLIVSLIMHSSTIKLFWFLIKKVDDTKLADFELPLSLEMKSLFSYSLLAIICRNISDNGAPTVRPEIGFSIAISEQSGFLMS
ncbi:hypothetical protein NF419_10810, partial [Streptococcus suis]|nr:hypothetical protein [Streptococcus suis]